MQNNQNNHKTKPKSLNILHKKLSNFLVTIKTGSVDKILAY